LTCEAEGGLLLEDLMKT